MSATVSGSLEGNVITVGDNDSVRACASADEGTRKTNARSGRSLLMPRTTCR